MKHVPPPRLPAFVAVPSRSRRDGWTPLHQASFLGALAETGSVLAAARTVEMSRESAYRLRRRAGAASFAAAWDAALGGVPAPARKVTPEELAARALDGSWRPVLRGGRFVASVRKAEDSALLSLLARLDRATRRTGARVGHTAESHRLGGEPKPGSASTSPADGGEA